MKRSPSCSFIFFSAVLWPGRGAVVTSPWKIKLFAATGKHREGGKKEDKKLRMGGGKKKKGRCQEKKRVLENYKIF